MLFFFLLQLTYFVHKLLKYYFKQSTCLSHIDLLQLASKHYIEIILKYISLRFSVIIAEKVKRNGLRMGDLIIFMPLKIALTNAIRRSTSMGGK